MDVRFGRRRVGERGGARGRDVVLVHEALGEILAAFELRAFGVRTENEDPGGAEFVAHSGAERCFRTDYGEGDIVRLGEFDELVGVGHADIDALGDGGDPGVAGGAVEFFRERGLAEFPGERVFAPARADDQNVHKVLLS